MSANSQEQEIDLGQLSKKIGGYFQKIIDSIFDFILFIKILSRINLGCNWT